MQGSDAALANQFAAYQRARGLATETIRVRRVALGLFAAWLAPGSLLDAERFHVERFLAEQRIGASSRNNYLSHLRAFYRWSQREGHVDLNPTALVEQARTRKRVPRPINESDFFTALAMADRRMRCWLLLGGVAGLRAQEIAGLSSDDLLFDTGLLVVSHPKGHRERTVPMHPTLELALRDYGVPRRGPLFVSRQSGQAIGRQRVIQAVNAYLAGLGIASTGHKLRTRFATLAYRDSRDLLLVANLLGHSSTRSTEPYVVLTPDVDARRVVVGLPAAPMMPTLFDA